MKRLLTWVAVTVLAGPVLAQDFSSVHWTVKNDYPSQPFAKFEFELRADGHYSARIISFKGKSKSRQGVLPHPQPFFDKLSGLHLDHFQRPTVLRSHDAAYSLETGNKSGNPVNIQFKGEGSSNAKELVDLMSSEIPGQLCGQLVQQNK